MIEYENRYGQLTLEPVTEFQPVSTIHGKDIPDDYKFDLDTAERIALLTENRRTQLVMETKLRPMRCYLVVHESASSACVVRVVSMNYIGPAAQQEIAERAAWSSVRLIY